MSTPTVPAKPRIIPARPARAAVGMVLFLALLWVIEAVDQFVLRGALDYDGIVPRQVDGLSGILWAPLLHAGWAHLIANSLPFLVLGFLVLAGGLGQFIAVTALVWLLGGFLTWLTGFGITVGASGVIFGWLAFLLFRGFFARSGRQIVLAVVLFLVYGGVLWGVLPGTPGVSWQAHLFGALAGILAARLVAGADRRGSRGTRPSDGVSPSPIGP
ncbi:rhomboid family intramembrane serine protease [Actinomycetospora soli]|uniref:rhomboid family intramembrane serine protease n=1 Tax=Actinomycetospora soli TaxID=2893887 RepID=UPI001E2FAD53|nr:rhomboid family intramembrane serine protease [Actinomycetospora soli]MCD2187062.1 rhomboid family intramembrane serine protease [Actinomycetospora soli]